MTDIRKMTALERANLYELAYRALFDKGIWAELGERTGRSIDNLCDVDDVMHAAYNAMGKVERQQFEKYARMATLNRGRFDWHSYRLALEAYVR